MNNVSDYISTSSQPVVMRLLTADDRNLWDTFVQSHQSGCFMQTWVWADFKELEDYQTFRYGIFTCDAIGNKLIGGCIFYYYPRSHSANLLLAPGGPLLSPPFEVEGIKLLLDQAKALARELGAIALRVEPLLSEKPAYLEGFVRAPADLLPSETLLINLQPAILKILQSMKQKGRYNIRLSQRHGVETRFTTDSQAIPIFYDLFWETVQRQQFFGEPYGFFINLCQSLLQANMAEIGLATWKNEVLAAILVVYWGDRATYLYGGRSAQQPHVMANYGLHWAAMQRAKARGCSLYDFYGYTTEPHHAYFKFSQFKRQFGGTVATTIGAHDYFFYNQLADTLIGLLQRSTLTFPNHYNSHP